MAEMQQFFDMHDMYKDVADFAMIYIEEAHAKDTWNVEVTIVSTFLSLPKCICLSFTN